MLYHLHRALGSELTLKEFQLSGEFVQTWCPAHTVDSREGRVLSKTSSRVPVTTDEWEQKTKKIMSPSNVVTDLRQTVYSVQKFTK